MNFHLFGSKYFALYLSFFEKEEYEIRTRPKALEDPQWKPATKLLSFFDFMLLNKKYISNLSC